jgi:hypothetical protein
MTQNWKASHLNIVIPLLWGGNQDPTCCLKIHAHGFLDSEDYSAGHDLRFLTPRLKWTYGSDNNESYTFVGPKKKNHCFLSMIKPDSRLVLNNADVNELYLVQISGLWGSSSLLHTHCFSSYIKIDGHCSRHCWKLVHRASAVTWNSTYIAQVINRQRPRQNKMKEKENTFLLCQTCLPGNESLNKFQRW